jgi:hypothetical protein
MSTIARHPPLPEKVRFRDCMLSAQSVTSNVAGLPGAIGGWSVWTKFARDSVGDYGDAQLALAFWVMNRY